MEVGRWIDLILCVNVPVIRCSFYAIIRLILLILYLTSCMSALERLIQSKDPYHFRCWIRFIDHLRWTHPLYQFLSLYQSYQYITKSITLVQTNTSKV